MASLNGQWKLSEVDANFSAYLDAINVAGDDKERALKLLTPENNIVQEITVGDEIVIKTTTPVGTSETKAKAGQEFETKALDGRPIKTVYKLDGDKLIEEQSGSFTSINTRSVSGNQMVMTQVAGGVTSTRKYTKV